MDDALRTAIAEVSTGEPLQLTALRQFITDRLPAFERDLPKEPTLTHAAAALAELVALGAPDVVLDAVRRHLRAVGEPGWRPVFDPDAWIPDAAAVAATVDSDQHPLVVDADITTLALFAALCAIGPAAHSTDPPPLTWHDLGVTPDPPDDIGNGVTVRVALYGVDRLAYALTPEGDAYLAVTVS